MDNSIQQHFVKIKTSRIYSEIAFATRSNQYDKRSFLINILEKSRIDIDIYSKKMKKDPYYILVNIDDAKKYNLIGYRRMGKENKDD